jgi:hypothetical protein
MCPPLRLTGHSIGRFPTPRWSLRRVLLAGGLVLSACDRGTTSRAADTAAVPGVSTPADSMTRAASSSGWDVAAGPFVVLPTVDGGMVAGSLLLPDAADSTLGDTTGVGALLGDGQLELFARGGLVSAARLSVETPPAGEAGCTAWPVARLAVEAGVTVQPWTAAFAAGRVTAIPLDSIEGLAPRDSAALAANLTRLASRLPDDSSVTFRGLPFVVLRAWRARGADDAFVVAVLARRVNQEDQPQEERVVMVVDTPRDDARSWRTGWHERAAGNEDELVVAEPLLAFRARGANDVRLLFGRDDGVALGAAVLSRRAGVWSVLWESAIAGCG